MNNPSTMSNSLTQIWKNDNWVCSRGVEINESSTPYNVIVIATSYELGEKPFLDTEHVNKVVAFSILSSVKYKLWKMEIKATKQDGYDIISPETIEEVRKFLVEHNITRVISFGRAVADNLFPSVTKGKRLAQLVLSPAIPSKENNNISVGICDSYHKVNKKSGRDIDLETDIINRINTLSIISDDVIKVNVVRIKDDEEFEKCLKFLETQDSIALDYETNAQAILSDNFKVTCISLAVKTSPTTAYSYYYIVPFTGLTESVKTKYTEFLDKKSSVIWAHNSTFEIQVTYHITKKLYKFQDTIVYAAVNAERMSLKELIRLKFGAPMWEAGVHEFMSLFDTFVKKTLKLPSVKELCLNGDVQGLRNLGNNYVNQFLDTVLNEYSMEEIQESIQHYPYKWGAIPKDMLGIYCAYDSGYTVLLANYYVNNFPNLIPSYNFCKRHAWLAAKFQLNGFRWDDKKAEIIKESLYKEAFDLLKYVIDNCIDSLSPESRLEYLSFRNNTLPFTRIYQTGKKRIKEVQQVISTYEEFIELLKTIWNPNSNTEESREIFWSSYLTEDLKISTVLNIFIEDMDLSGYLQDFISILPNENFLKDSSVKDILDYVLNYTKTHKDYLAVTIGKTLNTATKKLNDYIGKMKSDVIKYQYQVHTRYYNVKIEDETTWSKEFRMLFSLFYFKKIFKLITTNIDGSIGRENVYSANQYKSEKPIRHKCYIDMTDKEISDSSMFIMNTDFNTLAAASLRWTSGFHTIPAGSQVRECIVPMKKNHVLVHADYSQAELVTLAFLSGDPRMIQTFIDKKDMHKFVASLLFQKSYDEVTSEERRAAKSCSFGVIYGKSIENLAIDMTGGDVARAKKLYATFFDTFPGIKVWMNERHKEIDKTGDYVTSYIGNKLKVSTIGSHTGNAKYRIAVNAPIQSLSSLIAGTAMYELSEKAEEHNFECFPFGFTHDAYDDSTNVNTLFEYLELLIYVLQDSVYEKLGAPMRIDYEIGADGLNLCEIKFSKKTDNVRIVELHGTKSGIDNLIKQLNLSETYKIEDITYGEEKLQSYSFEELFTVGKALKYEWGKTIPTISTTFKVKYN